MAGTQLTCPVPVVQDPVELERLLEHVRALKPERILEIGSLYGGTLWHWMEACTGATVVSLDLVTHTSTHPRAKIVEARSQWEAWARDFFCRLHFYVAPSESEIAIEKTRAHGPYDFIFVDGGHAYDQVKADFENYWPMLRPGGLMAFHDIVYVPGSTIEVGLLWQEIRGQYVTEELAEHTDCYGIGLVWKGLQP